MSSLTTYLQFNNQSVKNNSIIIIKNKKKSKQVSDPLLPQTSKVYKNKTQSHQFTHKKQLGKKKKKANRCAPDQPFSQPFPQTSKK